MFKTFIKLVLILITFAAEIKADKIDDLILEYVFCINYLIWFKNDKIRALINSNNKINAMTLAYTFKLSFKVCFINMKAQ